MLLGGALVVYTMSTSERRTLFTSFLQEHDNNLSDSHAVSLCVSFVWNCLCIARTDRLCIARTDHIERDSILASKEINPGAFLTIFLLTGS